MSGLSELQQRFLDLLLSSGSLRFGEFMTKSGRMSPYFINTGCFDGGQSLGDVASCYATLIAAKFNDHIHLYGPAYKGITLASATAIELARRGLGDVPFTFNRKEQKDHGEGGMFVGRTLKAHDSVIIIEDVMTGGTSVRETMQLLRPRQVQVRAVVIGIDRQENGLGALQAAREIEADYGCPVYPILTIEEIVTALWNKERQGRVWIDDSLKLKIDEYRSKWSGRLG
jgi:orotate phosphoribosyltransferase